jgi:hypothetical protein
LYSEENLQQGAAYSKGNSFEVRTSRNFNTADKNFGKNKDQSQTLAYSIVSVVPARIVYKKYDFAVRKEILRHNSKIVLQFRNFVNKV